MISTNRIPGGLINGGEWLVVDGDSKFITDGKMVDFWDTPAFALNALMAKMKSKPKVESAMEVIVGSSDDYKKVEQFSKCQYGRLNTDPDIDSEGNLSAPEYVPCAERGICPVEGIGCSSLMVREGIFLTKVETEVIHLALWPDRIIAIDLGISELTVKTHWKNIRSKMGLQSKGQVIHWLTQRGII